MLKGSTKRAKRPFTFDQELDLKLKTLKEDTGAPNVAEKRRQMAAVLEQAVNELQLEEESSIENVGREWRNAVGVQYEIKEMKELSIGEHSGEKWKVGGRSEMGREGGQQKLKKANNHIWNLVSSQDLVDLLMHKFSDYQQEHQIILTDFIQKAFQFFFRLRLQKPELVKLEESLKYQLTTTDPQVLSLNALEISNKKINIKHFLIQAYIQVRLKQRMSELQRKNKKIMSEVTIKIDSLVQRQQQIQQKYHQISRQENSLSAKQKNLQIRQKQLLQREKEIKRVVEEKCYKLSEIYISQISEKVKQAQKRLNLLEKNIKTKLELIEKKSMQLRQLITEANQLKIKKNESEGQAKLRVRKLQRQMDITQKKYRSQIEQLEAEQKQMLRSVSGLEQKLAKNQRKVKKQKERIEELEQTQIAMKSRLEKLQQQNRQLNTKLEQISTRIPQQNVLKIIKQKQKTSRSNKSKHKKGKNDIYSVILLYEKVLQISQITPQAINFSLTTKLRQLTKVLLPQILSLICNDEDNLEGAPYHLVLFVLKAVLNSNLKRNINSDELSDHQSQKSSAVQSQNRIWSNELSSLMQMPFTKIAKRSIFLFLLPLAEWTHSSAAKFFTSTLEQCSKAIQQASSSFQANIEHRQLEAFSGKQLISYLICSHLQRMVKQLISSVQHNDNLHSHLQMSNSILNLFLQISKQYRQNIRDAFVLRKLVAAFEVLTQSLIVPYQEQQKLPKKGDTFFKHYQTIEQLCEKLSILIQRITYDSGLLTSKCSELGSIKKVYRELSEFNKINGQRNSLILANLSSILSTCQTNS